MYVCYNTVHGGWSSWSGWTSCTQSCGSGSQERSRTCTSPPPRYGGRSCVGAARQTQTCNKQACPGKKCKKCSVTSSSACTALGSFLLPIRRFLFVYPITIGKAMSCDVFSCLVHARSLIIEQISSKFCRSTTCIVHSHSWLNSYWTKIIMICDLLIENGVSTLR